jgi:hypothetical protein
MLLVLTLFIIASSVVSAHDYQNVTNINNIYNYQTGTAAAIAMAQLDFDSSTKGFQFGVGIGSYDGNSSLAIGASKKIGSIMIKGSAGIENNKQSLGAGIMWRY